MCFVRRDGMTRDIELRLVKSGSAIGQRDRRFSLAFHIAFLGHLHLYAMNHKRKIFHTIGAEVEALSLQLQYCTFNKCTQLSARESFICWVFSFSLLFFFSNIMDYYQSTIILSIYFNQFDRLEMKNISCHQSWNIPWKHHFNYIIHTCIVNWKAIIVSFYLRYNIVKYMGTGRVYWFCVIRKYEINVKLFYLNHPKFGFKIKNRKN